LNHVKNVLDRVNNVVNHENNVLNLIAIMTFDPTKPMADSPLDAAEMRNQLNALKALIDAQQVQIGALQDALASKATLPTMGEFDPGWNNPPTVADLLGIQGRINELIAELQQ
jgi:hypothetical protein